MTGFAEPDAIIMHPTDFQEIALTRTADGLYILSHPALNSVQTLWGLPVVLTTAIAAGTALVGAFGTEAQVFVRADMNVAISDQHSDFWIRNQVMIRAEVRVALAVFRPTAFCTVTGI